MGRPVAPPLALPPGVGYLWELFVRLDARRGSNGFGPAPISFADIAAFVAITGLPLTAWEIETIEAVDDAYMEAQAEKAKAKKR